MSVQGFNAGSVYYEVSLDTKQMLREAPEVDRTLRGVEFRFGAVALAVKGLVGALALLKMARVADDFRLLEARVNVAAGSVERGAAAFSELQRISARTQTELAANAQVFNRLNSSIVQMGGTQQDTLRITELLGKAIKVSGASGTEAASAMTQFGQALGSGKLAGDELRSLLENAPYLMKQLADGIGVPIGALKQLGEDGKLTADVVTAALSKAAGKIDADFKKLPQTFEAAMGALVDQLRRASEAGDTLAGTSAVLTGVARGAADAVSLFADQLVRMVGESDKLGRNDAIGEWSRRTTVFLSYIADAADITWQTLSVLGRNVGFVFETAGDRIGNLAAQARAVLNGDLKGAEALQREFEAVATARRAALDAADARTLGGRQLAGQAMREQLAALQNGSGGYTDRSDRLAAGGGVSKLTAPAGSDSGKAAKARKQETEAEIKARQDLARQARVDAAEQEADEQARAAAAKKAREDERAANERERNRLAAQDFIAGTDQIALLQLNLERRSALLAEYAAQDQENEALYAQARVALEEQTQARIAEIAAKRQQDQLAAQSQMLTNYGALFGSLADITKAFEGEQSGVYKAMFAVSKAFSIAQSIMAIKTGMAKAYELGWPAGLAAAATVAANGASLISAIKGTNFGGGRQYGGPVSAGSMYRVNETGQPEMFVGSGGKQYMLPTTGGQVVPADKVGGGMTVEFRIINQAPHLVGTSERAGSDGRPELVIAEVAAQIRDHRGPVWGALAGSTTTRARL